MVEAKAKIMDAASALFLEGGSKALSVRAIARQAGVSTIGIYSHFEGKQGILDALYIEGFEKVEMAMDLPANDPSHGIIIETLVRQYLQTAVTYEGHYRLIFGDYSEDYTPSPNAIAAGKAAFARLVDQARVYLPSLKPEERRPASLEIWALLHGFVSLRHHVAALAEDQSTWEDRVVRAVKAHVDVLLQTRSA